MNSATELDIGPLTWVKGEIDLALARADEAMGKLAAAPADTAQLKAARNNLRQARGALSIVGMDGITTFAEAAEALLAGLEEGSIATTPPAINAGRHGVAQIRQYLDDLIDGGRDQPLRLLPAYRELALARGLAEPGATEMFFPDLTLRPPRREKEQPRLTPDALRARTQAARMGFQRGLLKWFKGEPKGAAEMRSAVAMIEMTRTQPADRAFWWVSIALFEALAGGKLAVDAEIKKLCGRIDGQIKKLVEGSGTVADRLMRDVLYHVARAAHGSDHLECVRSAYQLDGQIPGSADGVDIDQLKPVLRAGRDLLATTKDHWNRFCAGTPAALAQFRDGASQLTGRLSELGNAEITRLASAIGEIADALQADPARHSEASALEVATALLLLEGSLENFPEVGHEFPHQVDTVASRLSAILRGEELSALEIPHLDEISRRAQERLLMHQVAKEVTVNLGVIEQALDAYFRNPAQRDDLTQLTKPLIQISGALIVMGQDRAADVLRDCEARIAAFRASDYFPDQAEFEDVAAKLSALGFFVEKLKFGPADIDAILNPAAKVAEIDEGPSVDDEIYKALTQTQILAAQLKAAPVAEQTGLREELKQNLQTLRQDGQLVADNDLVEKASAALDALDAAPAGVAVEASVEAAVESVAERAAAPEPAPLPPSAETARLADASNAEIDAELLSIFLEEAHEVLDTIADNLPRLVEEPHDRETMTTLRRAFHTLKGSGRMVGLTDLGEAGWAVEQTLNVWLQQDKPADPDLSSMLDSARQLFSAWVEQLEAGAGAWRDASALATTCAQLRGEKPAVEAEAAAIPAAAVTEVAEVDVIEEPGVEPLAPLEDLVAPAGLAELLSPEDSAPVPEPVFELAEAGPARADAGAVEDQSFDLPFDVPAEEFPAVPLAETAPPTPEALFAPLEDLLAEPVAPIAPIAPIAEAVTPDVEETWTPTPVTVSAPALAESEDYALPFDLPFDLPQTVAPPPLAAATADVMRVGDKEVSTTLYELFVEEAQGHVAALQVGLESAALIDRELLRRAHTLGGIAATTDFLVVHAVAHALEKALERLLAAELQPVELQRMVFARAVGALEGMIGAITQLRMPGAQPELVKELEAIKVTPPVTAAPLFEALEEPPAAPAVESLLETAVEPVVEVVLEPAVEPVFDLLPEPTPVAVPAAEPAVQPQAAPEPTVAAAATQATAEEEEEERRRSRVHDELDMQLLPFFLEEAQDLMRETGEEIRKWRDSPGDSGVASQLRRLLHTLKGSARMAGAMSVGEIVHGMETRIEMSTAITPAFLDEIETAYDRSAMLIENLRKYGMADAPEAVAETDATGQPGAARHEAAPVIVDESSAQATLRVRASLIDKLVNEAGEMAIARARVEGEMRTIKAALHDLTENVIRLRNQLREIDIQAESQMQSQTLEAQAKDANFDPLEFDRFTRLQELTRMMAESVNDVSTVQHNLLINLDHADAALVAQSRLNRELSQALMGVRMVPFRTVADRLYRVVRQTAKDTGKRANLDIRGGQTELDRSVLETMIGPIEHLLRNAMAHGLEEYDERQTAGKPEIGEIQLTLSQAGNEILIEMMDDGAGLNLPRIRARAIERGLLGAADQVDDAHIMGMIFEPGFSTAEQVSEVSGRGVGMDVVKTETTNLGGRVEIHSETGRGARFRIYLPLTLAVTQALLIRACNHIYAVPSTMVEQVSELKPEVIEAIRAKGGTEWLGNQYPWHYIAGLLGNTQMQPTPARRHWLLLLKGGSQRLALEVDGLVGNDEVVVKNIGPQLARVTGIAGATVLGDGAIAMILNPVALAMRQAAPQSPAQAQAQAQALTRTMLQRVSEQAVVAATPTVMVVDDSLTVRKITGRLLAREGYHVVTAKDGVDALEQLTETIPDVMLVDIEMPRMDGFDLARNVRADSRTRKIPIIMITSRIADKHRNYAMEIGVNHYLGKPFNEEELLALIAGFVQK